jgi:hypothetical protein
MCEEPLPFEKSARACIPDMCLYGGQELSNDDDPLNPLFPDIEREQYASTAHPLLGGERDLFHRG